MDPVVTRYWYPLVALSRREIRKRYATTMLGAAWTVLQPLALMVIYVVVFAFILRAGRQADSARDFAFYLLVGMLPYLAIADGLQRASTALREDRALQEREVFPAEILPVARVVAASVAEVVGLALLVVLELSLGMPASGWMLALPLLVVLRVVITCGLAWIVSILTIFVADLAEALSFILTAWLFLTPIFYTPESVPPALRWMTAVNPLYHLVEAYRSVLLAGRAPLPELFLLVAWAALFAGVGLWFFRKALDRAKDHL
jgi:ABC-type polysaccharide/polyol phosphate export permease